LHDASSNPLRSRSRNMRRCSRSISVSPLSRSSHKRRHSKIHHTSPKQKKRLRMESVVSTFICSPRHSPHQSPKSMHSPASQRELSESEEVNSSESD
jgi:hypothetical protein